MVITNITLDSITGKCSYMGYSRINIWNTLGKPISPIRGTIGLNTDTSSLEIYDGSTWIVLLMS